MSPYNPLMGIGHVVTSPPPKKVFDKLTSTLKTGTRYFNNGVVSVPINDEMDIHIHIGIVYGIGHSSRNVIKRCVIPISVSNIHNTNRVTGISVIHPNLLQNPHILTSWLYSIICSSQRINKYIKTTITQITNRLGIDNARGPVIRFAIDRRLRDNDGIIYRMCMDRVQSTKVPKKDQKKISALLHTLTYSNTLNVSIVNNNIDILDTYSKELIRIGIETRSRLLSMEEVFPYTEDVFVTDAVRKETRPVELKRMELFERRSCNEQQ